MSERWVLNASPLIVLARSGYEDLLLKLPEQVVVPQAVESEIQAGPAGDPARQTLARGRFPIVESPFREEILTWDLGRGETAVLSYALSNPSWIAILDDRAARTCARSNAIPYKGTLAVVILAR
jgi:predicted nucleic acid-binding protein